ncbi:MAG: TonB-dependent receptor [Bacteroidetes bacterium]|nr:TonB-dependent receptor [Bacteroidota bacterium]MBK9425307.1 TonB-dependent receptor [Bacteroidota bacterium]
MAQSIAQFPFHRYFLALFFLVTWTFVASGQDKATITGKVTDSSKRPLLGVNISIFGKPGGVASDEKGNYELKVDAGLIEVVFSSIGFIPYRETLTITPGQVVTINPVMIISATPLPAVEIKDEQFRRGTFTRIDPRTASQIPNVSGSFEAVLKSMPGVVSNNELSSQYAVRGGNYDENLVYVNDIEIYRPLLVRSGQQEGLSFINSDLVSQINFSAGGFEANYGDKLSSVLDIKYKKPMEFGGSAYASLLGGGLHLEGVSKNKKTGYLLGARYKSNQYLFKSLETKGEYKPSFADVQGLFTWDIDSNTELSVLGNFSFNKYQIIPENRETEFGTINEALRLTIYFDGQEIDEYRTMTGAVSFTRKLTDSLKIKFIASAYRSNESESFDIQGQYFIDELEKDIGSDNFGDVAFNRGVGTYIQHARNDLEATVVNFEHKGYLDRANSQLQWGARFQHELVDDYVSEWEYIDSAEYALPHPPDNIGGAGDPNQLVLMQEVIKTNESISSYRISGYLMHNYFWGDKTKYVLNTGVRANYWNLNEETVISPRVNFTIKPTWTRNLSFRIAAGFYYQPPFYRELRDFDGTVNKDVKAQRSIHLIGGADYVFLSWGREFKLVTEVYYKHLDNLVPYKIDNLRIRYFANNESKGYATGIDLRINGEFVEGIESWASVSVLKTAEDLKDDFYYTYYNSDGDVIVPGYTFNNVAVDSIKSTPGYIDRPTDQRFTFSLFFQDYLPKFPTFKMNMTLVYGTGLPFGPPGRTKYKDKLRFPDYRRVDIGFSKILIDEDSRKEYRLKIANKIKYLSVGMEVFNLLQVNNTVSYLWVTDVTNRRYAVPNYLSARTLNVKVQARF